MNIFTIFLLIFLAKNTNKRKISYFLLINAQISSYIFEFFNTKIKNKI